MSPHAGKGCAYRSTLVIQIRVPAGYDRGGLHYYEPQKVSHHCMSTGSALDSGMKHSGTGVIRECSYLGGELSEKSESLVDMRHAAA